MMTLSQDDLDKVAGGQFDENATYIKARVLRACPLYDSYAMDTVIKQLPGPCDVMLHPEFLTFIDRESQGLPSLWLKLIRVDGGEYCIEQQNVTAVE